jgi:hypothetical protein
MRKNLTCLKFLSGRENRSADGNQVVCAVRKHVKGNVSLWSI